MEINDTPNQHFFGVQNHIVVIFLVKNEYFIAILFGFENNHPKGSNLGWFCNMSILGKFFF
jgi:hypothetical protein